MNRTDAKKIAAVITVDQVATMFENAKEGTTDWASISKVNKALTRGDTLADQPDIFKWSGMNDEEGRFLLDLEPSLAVLNDEKGYSFEKMADIIERRWEEL